MFMSPTINESAPLIYRFLTPLSVYYIARSTVASKSGGTYRCRGITNAPHYNPRTPDSALLRNLEIEGKRTRKWGCFARQDKTDLALVGNQHLGQQLECSVGVFASSVDIDPLLWLAGFNARMSAVAARVQKLCWFVGRLRQ